MVKRELITQSTTFVSKGYNDVTFTNDSSDDGVVRVNDMPLQQFDSFATGTPNDLESQDFTEYKISFENTITSKLLVVHYRELI